jgi:beta-xylosidase
VGQSYPIVTPPETDEFDGEKLGLQWQWSANENIVWSSKLPGQKFLRLFSMKVPESENNLWNVPNLLTQKFPAPNFAASTKVKLTPEDAKEGKTAGLLVMGLDHQSIVITNKPDGFYLQLRRAEKADKGGEEKILFETKLKTTKSI